MRLKKGLINLTVFFMIMKKMNINTIKKHWIKIQDKNVGFTIFQQYEMTKLIVNHYFFFSLKNFEFPVFYSFFEGTECVLIAPLCKRLSKKNYYVSFGATADLAFSDFIYSNDLDYGCFEKCIDLLISELKIIKFYRVPKNSYLHKYLELKGMLTKENINVAIESKEDYQSHFQSLSKSVRQNIRTAYNRLNTDQRNYKIDFFYPERINRRELKKVMKCYINRRENRYGFTINGFLQKWFLKHYHYNTIGFSKLSQGMYAILYIDDQVAAFWGGYVNTNMKCILVPRLAINDEFKRYSPGYILINETLKVLKDNYCIDVFDLSKGDERYKLDLGGVVYKTYNYDLFCNQK